MDIEVVQFSRSDIPFGKSLTDSEDWHRTLDDWERLIRIEPRGLLKARSGGKDIGIGAVLTYDDVGWIHSLIVHKRHRGIGAGKALLEACVSMAEEWGVATIKLDSVPGFEPFYEHMGFKREFESRRFIGSGVALDSVAMNIRRTDLPDVFSFDRTMTGMERRRVLEEVYSDAPELAYSVREGDKVAGYAMGRRGELYTHIGPVVSNSEEPIVAARLIGSVMHTRPSGKFRICVPGFNSRAVSLVSRLGLEGCPSSTRMFRGATFQESLSTYGMISPEKG